MKKKLAFSNLILMILYFFICFFIFGLLIRIVIELYYSGRVELDLNKLLHLAKMSGITSFSITLAAFVFNKIDEYNVRKKKPDPQDPPEKS
jgi:hypothetical protein